MTHTWLPLLCIVAHLCEEFLWPGGFVQWYRAYPPGHVVSVSTRFIVVINAVFVALGLLPIFLGPTPQGFGYWAVVAAIAGVNGLFHLWATTRTRAYSPGVVTGVALYLPLAIVGIANLWRRRLVATPTVLQAVIIAVAYASWSAWKHRRGTTHSGARAH